MTPELIASAAERIRARVRATPLERARWLDREVWLKLECFQETGSFKLRGAFAKLTALSPEERAQGVLTVSAGNHGQAVALAAERLGLRAVVVVPKSAAPTKVAAIRRYPVELIEAGEDYDAAERAARSMAEARRMVFVSPYNDPEVIAGQGTLALEILAEQPELDAIVVPVGGGGLAAGVAIASAGQLRVFGAEPEASPTLTASLAAGRVVQIAEQPTIADGLAGNIELDSLTFQPLQRLLEAPPILVSEAAIRAAILRAAREAHLFIEGASAAALAALDDPRLRDLRRIAVVITGRNIDLDRFLAL